MILSDEQKKEFEKVTKPVIDFMNTLHPHTTIIIDSTRAELSEGVCSVNTYKYVKD